MDHRVHVRLIREGVLGGGKIWADLGSGEGAFTLALADLLGPTGSIHTVDRDSRALQVQVRALRDAFPNVKGSISLPAACDLQELGSTLGRPGGEQGPGQIAAGSSGPPSRRS